MAEPTKKPTGNRSAKERRNTLFRVLDGVLSLAHKKFMPALYLGIKSSAKTTNLTV